MNEEKPRVLEETTEETTQEQKKSLWQNIVELVRFVFITLLIVVPIRMFIAQPFVVSGDSMVQTFENGDYLIVDELSYHFKEPQRGEVVVFKHPNNQSRFLIKRVIAMPNEKVSINGSDVEITKADGTVIALKEDYVNGNFSSYLEKELGDEEYFVMGDNRKASSDSRSWGTLSEKLIVGRTFLRLFPVSELSFKPGTVLAEDIETYKSQ